MGKNKNKKPTITINWKRLIPPAVGFIIGLIAFLWVSKRIF